MPDFKLKNVTWRLHEQRGRLHESVELRRKYLEQSRARQLPRKLFLKLRLRKIKEHLKDK